MNEHYKQTLETWDKVADLYKERFMDYDLYNDTYDIFCGLIEKKDPSVFEIGCGPGNITRYILSKRPDLKIEAIDTSPNMIKLAKANNHSADFLVMDCREIDTIEKKFDAIICGFCLPYLAKEDVAKFIKDCSGLLNPGGAFYFSAIEDDYNKSKYETSSNGQFTMFVYYHEENYLMNELKENNFELVKLERKRYTKANGTNEVDIIFIARKK